MINREQLDQLAEAIGLDAKFLAEAKEMYSDYLRLKAWTKTAEAVITLLIDRQGGQVTVTNDELDEVMRKYEYHIRQDTAREGTLSIYLKTT